MFKRVFMTKQDKWSQNVTQKSHALDLEKVCLLERSKNIAESLIHAAEKVLVEKVQFINLLCLCLIFILIELEKLAQEQKAILIQAKDELRKLKEMKNL